MMRSFYNSEYYYNHAEPHRRRPSIVEFPCVVWHIGIYYPQSKKQFIGEIEKLFNKTLTNNGWQLVKSFIERPVGRGEAQFEQLTEETVYNFFNQPWLVGPPQRQSKKKIPKFSEYQIDDAYARKTVFCLECVPSATPGGPDEPTSLVRFELHTEYMTVTLFSAYVQTIGPDGESLIIKTYREGISLEDVVFPRVAACDNYKKFMERLGSEDIADPLSHLIDNGHSIDPDGLSAQSTYPLSKLIFEVVSRSQNGVFCDFRGAIAPWTVFTPYTIQKSNPERDIFESPGYEFAPDFVPPDGSEPKPDFGKTQDFIHRIWPSLTLSVFRTASENLVACYMQGGSALYLSAVGAQGIPPTRSGQAVITPVEKPLTFALLYDEPSKSAAAIQGRPDRWRLSRLLNRLIEVGVRRTASLRHLAALRNAGNHLKEMESAVDKAPQKGQSQIDHLRSLMENLSSTYSEMVETDSLQYRVNRSRLHYSTMKHLISDLDVVKIPGFHPYDHFVRRRLESTQESIISTAVRLERLEERLRARMEFADTFPSHPMKLIAAMGFAIAVAALVGDAAESIRDVPHPWPDHQLLAWLNWAAERMQPLARLYGMLGSGIATFAWLYWSRRSPLRR